MKHHIAPTKTALRATIALLGLLACMPTAQAGSQVTKLASNVFQNLYGIAVDASGIYVTGASGPVRSFTNTPAGGLIGHIPLAGGTVTTLYSSANYPGSGHVSPMQIATDGAGTLYWADPDAGFGTGAAFYSGSTAGGTPNQFFGICCGPGVLPGDSLGVTLNGATLYFSDMTGARIGALPVTGGTPAQIGITRYTPDFNTESFSQITHIGAKIYIADSGQDLNDGGGTPTQMISDESASITPAVREITATATTPVFKTLSAGIIPSPHGIVAVGTTLYVTSGNTIWKVNAKTGATSVFLQNDQFLDLQGIAYYKNYFYIADSQNTYGPFVSGNASATSDLPGVVWRVKR